MKAYIPGTAEVVAAVVAAKEDETYARKLHRAVLIAWARGANVGTEGLRRAFREHFHAEEKSCIKLVSGRRVEDGEPELRFGPAFNRAVAAAKLDHRRTSEDLGTFEESTGEVVRAAFWRSGQRDLLPVGTDRTTLGLAELREDGTWRITKVGEQLWEGLAMAPYYKITRTARREELEAGLYVSRSFFPAHGFRASDFVVACQAPKHVWIMRRWYGLEWWRNIGKSTTTPIKFVSTRRQR
jgi:hypothetical protein